MISPSELAVSKDRNRILSIIKIASLSGQAISFIEISLLLINYWEPSKIKVLIQNDKRLFEKLTIKNNFVVLKGYENLFLEKSIRNLYSKKMIDIAKIFVKQIIHSCPHLKLIGVCGSVAYNSAVKSDDIDLFIVARKRRLWISILKIYIFARALSLKAAIERNRIAICLSYAVAEDRLKETMITNRSPLFAREFLSLHVLTGEEYFKKNLERNIWFKKYFPRLYNSKLQITQFTYVDKKVSTNNSESIHAALNLGIFRILKMYLSIKALTLNLSFKKTRKYRALFQALISSNSLVYTSEKYREIERIYEKFEKYR